MTHLLRRTAYLLMLSLVLGLPMARPALAQFGGQTGIPGAGNIATGQRANRKETPTVAEPDAVPGAKARVPAAPSTHVTADLSPNDALFDAINRGDIVSARDALARGADLGAVNVLGMTPMELSVDLGRNDISFLLLSMRGEDAGRGSRAVARSADAPPIPGKSGKRTEPVRTVASKRPTEHAALPEKPAVLPKLFANDGGTPLPSAGFLGFGARQATN